MRLVAGRLSFSNQLVRLVTGGLGFGIQLVRLVTVGLDFVNRLVRLVARVWVTGCEASSWGGFGFGNR